MTRRSSIFLSIAALAAVALLAACGGSPTSSSSMEDGVVVRGALAGSASALSGASSAAVITVSVKGQPGMQTTVGADGSFTLRGLPPGDFTLVFKNGNKVIGELDFDGVAPNQEITITVKITSSGVTLMDEHRNGIGHGDVEIEDKVDAVVIRTLTGDSRFQIGGYTVVARPGQTAIRQGNSARTVNAIKVGTRVHVKGVWLPSTGSATQQLVLAHEIKIQGGGSDPGNGGGGGGGNGQVQCNAGGHAEVEGLISGKGGSSITVTQQGKGDYLCLVSGSTRIRKGNTNFTFDQLQLGWRVHVKGNTLGMSGSACQVDADEVKVQNN